MSTAAERSSSPALAPPPGNEKIVGLDGLRGLMVLTVVLYHVGEDTGALTGHGWSRFIGSLTFAPDVFMMLSGFLLYRPFVTARVRGRPRPGTLRFFRKRALRVFPAYWVAITLAAIWPGLPGVFTRDWWMYYGLLHIYFTHGADGVVPVFGGIAVSWTLCTEISFYLVLTALALWGGSLYRWLGPTRGRAVEIAVLVLFGAEAIWWHHTLASNTLIAVDWARSLWLPGLACYFAVGMILALLTVPVGNSRHPRELLGRSLWPFACVCFAGAVACFLLYCYGHSQMEQWLLNGAISALVFVPAALARPSDGLGKLLGSAVMEWLAVVSYGAYLYHRPIIWALERAGLGGHSALDYVEMVLPALALSLIAGQLCYRIVELPFLKLKYGSLRRAPQAQALSAPE
jgi:peptidoglycan/LPS O-acetylase OafA/YrhL